ncbi:MAG: hypothetical protein H6936_01840 [Burkholderiales bacterium]|nr:hypothetical protein [Nitrosomonas sp.]MCP5273598.1 hypothetical protein [Burkholderiales bacterium]
MYKKLICAIIFLALCLPVAAFAESEEVTNDSEEVTNEAAEEVEAAADIEEEASEQELQKGNGWRKVRIAELGKSGKFVQMVLIEHSRHTDKTIYSNAIKRLCKPSDEFCRVRFWSEERYIPNRVAMTPEQRKQLKADYLVNKSAGMHHLQWSCGIDPNSENCL